MIKNKNIRNDNNNENNNTFIKGRSGMQNVSTHTYAYTHITFYMIKLNRKKPGGRLNKKDGLTRYGDSHVKDKTS